MRLTTIKKGFTLIELLVVITIIGILATGATSVYTAQIQKARDSTRISDVNTLKWWIEQFYQDTTVYPLGWENWLQWAWVDIQDFVPSLAEDPKHNQTCNGSRCWYVYTVGPDLVWINQWSYELSTAFESEGNRESKAVSTSDNWDDDNRMEVWILKSTSAANDLDTSSAQWTAFVATAIPVTDTSTATVVIINSSITQK